MAIDDPSPSRCPSCGAVSPVGSRFCAQCGKPFAVAGPEPVESAGPVVSALQPVAAITPGKTPWYRQPGWIIVLLVFVFPVGLLLMWLNAPWSLRTKKIITGLIIWPAGAWWIWKETDWPQPAKYAAWAAAAVWVIAVIVDARQSSQGQSGNAFQQNASASVAGSASDTLRTQGCPAQPSASATSKIQVSGQSEQSGLPKQLQADCFVYTLKAARAFGTQGSNRPKGIYLAVLLTIQNATSSGRTINSNDASTFDSSGTSYPLETGPLSSIQKQLNGIDYPAGGGIYLGSASTKDAFVLFDVPPTAKGLHLKLAFESGSARIGQVDMDLGDVASLVSMEEITAALGPAVPTFFPPTPLPTATPLPPELAKQVLDHLGAAYSFRDAGNWPAALKELDAALGIDPQNPDATAARSAVQATATAAVPTVVPTSPKPTVAPQSGFTPAEQAYIDTVAPKTVILAASFNRFSQLAADPLNNLSQIRSEVTIWQAAYNQWVSEPKPPASLAEVDAHWGRGLQLINESAVNVTRGVDTLNGAYIQQASAQLVQGTAEVQAANQALNRFKASRGI